ncbi:SRPBCC family protein [Streptomyces stelliscabiei]|uniref:hypothetical protein n=1 Tax=Streptomyces stelliscabiei TaxID=146820 RepID=UPI0029A56A44|nr:hypothetical protein [Streptomyces stelliscabiei]MDX2552098.1 hypothetical protein [Streptomyces stelliscabiei]MDX2609534.1 hypothetical protein [Streptomyces stelliscabiei]MDX2636737.1 hypothetical protein [Streptomyces stelliscabiei]MDX2660169.1 hypothetical protein [Streptomyces stelliscabiei]MDX2710798.1 hypothetical protein [Streptomyces stelliscabiei]
MLADEELVHWMGVFTSLRRLSPRPFGIGAVREVTLPGVFTARERFFRWDV